ncbi:uncharacterized protein LOC135476351 [Liolophura sinensis]|uniref:uncharacterized protein LOC135476351 n=1 Tax=Liolophura sinensis TaxID=3198878 RepID=UPI0031589CCC
MYLSQNSDMYVFQASPVIGFAGKKSLNQNEYLFEGDTSQETTAPVDDNDDVMSSMSESLLSHQNIPFTNSNAPVSSQTWRKGMGTKGDNSQSRHVKGHNSDWMGHSQGTQFSPSILGPQHVSQMQQSFKTSLPNEGSVLSGFNEEEVDLLHKCQNRLKDIKILLNTSSNNHQDVMVKIGETQGLIIQGLETLHSSNGVISSDWKTRFETLKGHLGQIRQAHDVKREQLALQVKQRGQTKDKRQKIHKELLSLSMQQKSLLNLFQKQQDINKLMKSCIQTAQSSDLSQQKTLSSRSSPVSDPRSSPRSHSNSRSVPRSRSSLTKSPLTLSGSSKSSPSVTKSAQNEKLPNEDLKKKREEESQAEWNTISASTTDMTASKLGDKEKTFSRGFDSETQPLASETRNWVHVRL